MVFNRKIISIVKIDIPLLSFVTVQLFLILIAPYFLIYNSVTHILRMALFNNLQFSSTSSMSPRTLVAYVLILFITLNILANATPIENPQKSGRRKSLQPPDDPTDPKSPSFGSPQDSISLRLKVPKYDPTIIKVPLNDIGIFGEKIYVGSARLVPDGQSIRVEEAEYLKTTVYVGTPCRFYYQGRPVQDQFPWALGTGSKLARPIEKADWILCMSTNQMYN